MSDPVRPPFKVLFVDDDRSFLEMARQCFGDLSHETWNVLTAADAATTSSLLQQHQVDLIVLDVRMPEISGLQLIGILQREHPTIPKVFLAAVVEEAERVAGLESGAAMFLEKPTNHAGLHSIFATLDELLKWQEKRGASSAPRASILDLVKLECSSKHSRIFEVFNADVRGVIYIENGAIIHAEAPGRRGQSAFSFLTTLLDGEFHLRQYTPAPERSIVRQWEFLYLEAVQLREQLAQAAADAKAKPAPEPSPAQPPSPTAPPSPATPPPTAPTTPTAPASPPTPGTPQPAAPAPTPPRPPGVTDEEATRQLFRRPGPPAVPTPPPTSAPTATAAPAEEPLQLRMLRPDVASPAPGARGEVAPDQPATAAPSPTQEILVCSYSAEVLYEWQCPKTETRLKFVETAHGRSERISQHLPVGPVDRLELQSAASRILLRFQDDGAILLRTHSGVEPGAPGAGQFHQSMAGWLARHATLRGLLAAGVIRPKGAPINQTVSPKFARENLAVAWRCAQEILDLAPEQELDPWQLRWVFESAQLYITRRDDRQALAMFLSKNSAEVDTSAVERVFQEFKSLQAP